MQNDLFLDNLDFKVSEDIHIQDELYNITPELNDIIEDMYYLSQSGKNHSVKVLQKYVKKYPHIPQFKNYLYTAYIIKGNKHYANQVSEKILEIHPDYLFGKLNKASKYFYEKQYDKMTELLGEEMSLKGLYPERDIFHFSEVLNFLKTAILYYKGTENVEKAEECYDAMLEIEQHFDLGDAQSSQVFMHIAGLRMLKAQKRFEEEEKTKIQVKVTPDAIVQKSLAPVFTHPEIDMLYENDFSIGKDNLDKILSLPRESLIEDLQKVLTDSIERQEYFEREMEETDYDEEKHSFPIHAIFLLGELKAVESIPFFLDYLKRDYDFYDFWFSDMFTEFFAEPAYKITKDHLGLLKGFMLTPGISTHTKLLILQVIEEVVIREPERKDEVVDLFKEIFRHFLNSKIEDNIIDSDLIAFMAGSATEFDGLELLPEIEELYSRKYYTQSVSGDIAEIKERFTNKKDRLGVHPILPIVQRYEEFCNMWYKPKSDYDTHPALKNDNFHPDFLEDEKPSKDTFAKVGRNEPCPCGSGKKYKKCCLNK